ncbi:Anthranilate phosphoribosyltransferase [Phycisphaerae bacterium RAS1]|nr:Anthranilate phosphoribosyltransferase [Phycisphaerae bacterium RAS1]
MPGSPAAFDARPALALLTQRQDLSRSTADELFGAIMEGRVEPLLLAALLAAFATKGETIDELAAAAAAMRARVRKVALPAGVAAVDTCGTGGDGKPTFNISSAVAIVAAAAGATVAKHGNRSFSRPSGSAEALAALGINVEADVPTLEACLAQVGLAFLYAPQLHPAMRYAADVRRSLGVRTLFNLVGPLTNPAGVRRQLLGVPRIELVEKLAAVLAALGVERAMVVCGHEGLCDLSVSGLTRVARVEGDSVQVEDVSPEVIGCRPQPLDSAFVGSPAESAALIRDVLSGRGGAARDIVVYNAAATLWVAGLAEDWADGAARARRAIESGAAAAKLEHWRRASHGVAG